MKTNASARYFEAVLVVCGMFLNTAHCDTQTAGDLVRELRSSGRIVGWERNAEAAERQFSPRSEEAPVATLKRMGFIVVEKDKGIEISSREKSPLDKVVENITIADSSVADAVKALRYQTGISLFMLETPANLRGKRVSLQLHNVEVREALSRFAVAAGVSGWTANEVLADSVKSGEPAYIIDFR